jgi:mannosyltransferase OCH1-like enzyme
VKIKKLVIEREFKGTGFYKWYTSQKSVIRSGKHFIEHISDALRLAIVFKHGGLYLDLDVINLKPLDRFVGYPGLASVVTDINE